MLKEVLIGVCSTATVVGIIVYLIRQGIWERYIKPLVSRKPKLSIRFEDGMDVIHVQQSQPGEIEQMVEASMNAIQKEHPYERYTEPSFENPFPQLFEGDSTNKRIYNDLLKGYYKEKESEFRNIHQGTIEDRFMKPLKLYLRNDGNVPSGKMNIVVNVQPTKHVYMSDARQSMTADTVEPPICIPEGAFPILAYKREPYSYYKWDFSKCIQEQLEFSKDFLNHQSQDDSVFPVIYVDTRFKNKVSISYRIIDSSVMEPYSGELIIWIDETEDKINKYTQNGNTQ